ncbi:hypothetical protein ACTRXD_04635 [Nitrospira sp. T9]|uniref:hypothetical protein n=1 Tax=Nitrospira sp. T9 TaxID=3456077 RepID=UPI003F9DD5EF
MINGRSSLVREIEKSIPSLGFFVRSPVRYYQAPAKLIAAEPPSSNARQDWEEKKQCAVFTSTGFDEASDAPVSDSLVLRGYNEAILSR